MSEEKKESAVAGPAVSQSSVTNFANYVSKAMFDAVINQVGFDNALWAAGKVADTGAKAKALVNMENAAKVGGELFKQVVGYVIKGATGMSVKESIVIPSEKKAFDQSVRQVGQELTKAIITSGIKLFQENANSIKYVESQTETMNRYKKVVKNTDEEESLDNDDNPSP